MEKTMQELYDERVKRVEAAIRLEEPDRIPIIPMFHLFPVKYTGLTMQQAHDEYETYLVSSKKTVLDFEPDMYYNPQFGVGLTGDLYDALDFKQIKLPGHGISPDLSFQFAEEEYMKADEYDAFLDDPTDYAIRTILPRTYGALDPLKYLPSLKTMLLGYAAGTILASFASMPQMVSAFEALAKAGRASLEQAKLTGAYYKELAGLGFPVYIGPFTLAPFDMFSDMLRAMRGSMLDMYRQPQKLLEAMDKVYPMLLETTIDGAKRTKNPRVYIPLHRGADGFMSLSQFETFYWPGLKKLMLDLIDAGLTPCPFMEGSWTQRLEYLTELPKGKIIAHLDATDIFKAKEVIGHRICIQGNVPLALLQIGSPQEVESYCKKLIDVVGKGGGFILDAGGAMDEAKPELVKVMMDFTREYGVY